MRFEIHSTGEMIEIEFGKNIRGIHRNNERPLNCYISPEELGRNAYRMSTRLKDYLQLIQASIEIGGRVVIK